MTDREIAILHLALVGVADRWTVFLGKSGEDELREFLAEESQHWDGVFDEASLVQNEHQASDTCSHCCVRAALAMVPLYRHAFGIEAPCDTGINNSFCSCSVCMTRALQREADKELQSEEWDVIDSCGDVFADLGVSPPASLATAPASFVQTAVSSDEVVSQFAGALDRIKQSFGVDGRTIADCRAKFDNMENYTAGSADVPSPASLAIANALSRTR